MRFPRERGLESKSKTLLNSSGCRANLKIISPSSEIKRYQAVRNGTPSWSTGTNRLQRGLSHNPVLDVFSCRHFNTAAWTKAVQPSPFCKFCSFSLHSEWGSWLCLAQIHADQFVLAACIEQTIGQSRVRPHLEGQHFGARIGLESFWRGFGTDKHTALRQNQ